MLSSSVFDWNSLTVQATSVGERRDVADSPTATLQRFECHITTLNPGLESHPPHRHPDEEWIIVKEGEVEATINGESHVAGPGSIVFFASNDLHGLRNAGPSQATYYVVRVVTERTPAR